MAAKKGNAKALLLFSHDAWNNDRTDNFANAIVKLDSELDDEERETFYPCSMYFEVGAKDDTGYECLKIEEQEQSWSGNDFSIFLITLKGPNGDIVTLTYPNPSTIDCREHDWAMTTFGGEEGSTVSFCIDDAKTYKKIDRKKVEDFISHKINEIRGEEDEEDSEAEFYPVGEGRVLGDITSISEYQPLARAEELASEFSVERVNPTVVTGSEDVRAEEMAAEEIKASHGCGCGMAGCGSCESACGCSCMCSEEMANESMPLGDGQVLGDITADTDYTPFGSRAEDFKAQGYDDKLDESLGMSDKESDMEQDYKDRRDESAGMERSRGRRKYARVGTMDEDDRFSAEFGGMKTFATHAVPLGVGSVTGQTTSTTDFTPFGVGAEEFAADCPNCGWNAESFEAEQVVPFGVVGSGNDFGQNLAEDFGADTIISQDEWEDFYEVQMSGSMNMMGHWNIRKFMPSGNYGKAKEWFEEDGNTEDLVIKGAEDFGAESKYGMWAGLGLAVLAGIGAKMALDRMGKTSDEAPDSEESSEDSDGAPDA